MSDQNAPAPSPETIVSAASPATLEAALTQQLSFDGDGNILGMKADIPRATNGQFMASTETAQAPAPSQSPETPAAPAAAPVAPEEPMIPFLDFGPVKASEIPVLHQQHLEMERNRAARQFSEAQAQASQYKTAAESLQAKTAELQAQLDAVIQWARTDPASLSQYVANAIPQQPYMGQQPAYGAPNPVVAPQPNTPKYMTEEQVMAKWNELRAQEAAQIERERAQRQLASELEAITSKEISKELFGEAQDDVIKAIQYRIANAPKGTFTGDMPAEWVKRKIQTLILDVKNNFLKLRGGLASQQAALTQTISPQPASGMTPMPRVEQPRLHDLDTEGKANLFAELIARQAGIK